MTVHQPSPPLDALSPSEGNARKRVCKACDRCRLKKSKCDGANPCGRCKTDNAICVFGERKKAHDKVYPKGYVEMLEQQQAQLVTGLQALYKMTLDGEGWPGDPLKESANGHPLTHDILERLGALKQEGHSSDEPFEDDLQLAQKKLIANGAGFMQRQDSSDGSESEHSPTFPSRQSLFDPPFSINPNQLPPTPPSPHTFPSRAQHMPEHILEGMVQQQQHQHQFLLHHQRQQEQNKGNLQQHRQQVLRHQRHQLYQKQQMNAQRQKQLQKPSNTQQKLAQAQASQSQVQMFFNAPGSQPSMNPSLLQRQQAWPQGGVLDENMDLTVDSPLISFDSAQQTQAYCRPISLTGGLNSCLPIQPDWVEDADFKEFLNPTVAMI
ncbi:C6 transcription factor [Histoplasma capsulatum var. duboisii H88]|uniref:C6 transcription factor n=2 Tax=Ajellomyces capsulatus TaxID=5037 RepID=F0UAF5_AJEC8|nr:C6 transcription factor [Histoplasma capsulatum var. duboisii H88]QSS49067.1 C6 transcription factor [Histoplasma capsulatum var. duboisii H88]